VETINPPPLFGEGGLQLVDATLGLIGATAFSLELLA